MTSHKEQLVHQLGSSMAECAEWQERAAAVTAQVQTLQDQNSILGSQLTEATTHKEQLVHQLGESMAECAALTEYVTILQTPDALPGSGPPLQGTQSDSSRELLTAQNFVLSRENTQLTARLIQATASLASVQSQLDGSHSFSELFSDYSLRAEPIFRLFSVWRAGLLCAVCMR